MKISVTMEFEGADAMERAAQFLARQGIPPAATLEGIATVQIDTAKGIIKKNLRKKAAAGAAKVTEALNAAVPPATSDEPAKVGVEAVEKALDKLFDAKGIEVARGVMARFGVKRGRELKPEQYSDFVTKCEEVVAGGEV